MNDPDFEALETSCNAPMPLEMPMCETTALCIDTTRTECGEMSENTSKPRLCLGPLCTLATGDDADDSAGAVHSKDVACVMVPNFVVTLCDAELTACDLTSAFELKLADDSPY